MKRWIIALIFILTSALVAASELIFEQKFDSKIEGFSVTTTRKLEQLDDGSYRYRIRSSNFVAKLEEQSHFRIEGDQYIPLRHTSESRVFGVKRFESIDFDWNTHLATVQRKGETSQVELVPGYLDRALYQYVMEQDLLSGNPSLSYNVVDKGRIRNFSFETLGVEPLAIGNTTVDALKLKRITDSDERETLAWFAPSLDYQLVRIEHREDDGSDYSMVYRP